MFDVKIAYIIRKVANTCDFEVTWRFMSSTNLKNIKEDTLCPKSIPHKHLKFPTNDNQLNFNA